MVKPFVGPAQRGPSDAAVLLPMDAAQGGARQGLALATGCNPAYTALDPYAMAWAAADEAMRNCVAVGADPDRIALLDNFCWGNPTLPDRLGALVRCAAGCYDAAVAYGAPFVSGKDSLNNEYTGADGVKHAIPGTLLISSLGIVDDVQRATTSDLKAAGDRLYVVGVTAGELGGAAYARLNGLTGGRTPQPAAGALATFRALHAASAGGLVRACHDPSEGGLAVALAEMALGGELGAELDLTRVPATNGLADAALAFSESLSRFIVEVAPTDAAAFERVFAGLPCALAGRVATDDRVRLLGLEGQPFVATTLADIEHAWRGHLV